MDSGIIFNGVWYESEEELKDIISEEGFYNRKELEKEARKRYLEDLTIKYTQQAKDITTDRLLEIKKTVEKNIQKSIDEDKNIYDVDEVIFKVVNKELKSRGN